MPGVATRLVKRIIITLLAVGFLAGCAHRKDESSARVASPAPATPPSLVHPITVIIHTTNRAIYVDGEVGRSCRLIWTEGLNLTNAVSMAGGFTDFANRSRLEIHRSDGSLERYSYARIIRGLTNSPILKPNDLILVPRLSTTTEVFVTVRLNTAITLRLEAWLLASQRAEPASLVVTTRDHV